MFLPSLLYYPHALLSHTGGQIRFKI